ncbi:hypothetical protein GOOTI_266_00220 [Gordonia otitidis NBRC 100426]|uniref:Uncharacterized protein n=1 Tax=Gordonia otitidis (strain DSM 44809 / CCUG 52243 / JCM 12355 / NBRC 100426 / IFM 10032) TaxID=1108044 RepID=H5TUH5_GORO1|nr:hypothetical protein GOOTI_266_00220 [Gordonia otitidis NBRC 100426]
MDNWPLESRALTTGGETFTTEFKRSDINDQDLTKTVPCLANGEGRSSSLPRQFRNIYHHGTECTKELACTQDLFRIRECG